MYINSIHIYIERERRSSTILYPIIYTCILYIYTYMPITIVGSNITKVVDVVITIYCNITTPVLSLMPVLL